MTGAQIPEVENVPGRTATHGVVRSGFSEGVRIPIVVVLLTSAAVYESLHLSSVIDADTWWHLRTGLWILKTRAVPHSGIFSQHVSLPWRDSSWAYDTNLAALYSRIGLAAVPLLAIVLKIAAATTLFLLAGGSRRNFWPATMITACAIPVLASLAPGPVMCSTVLMGVLLAVLIHGRRASDLRRVRWSPALFVVWANVDTGFVYGLIVVALLVMTDVVLDCGPDMRAASTLWSRKRVLAAVAVGSAMASMLSPYTYGTYLQFFKHTTIAAFSYVPELHAIRFREPQDYLLLLIAMAAFGALGRVRSRDPFLLLLLAGSSALSFAVQRDRWVVAVVAVAVIADSLAGDAPANRSGQMSLRRTLPAIVSLTIIVVGACAAGTVFNGERITRKIESKFPVRACDYIRRNHLRGPLFNDYEWGGFATWYLPEQLVVIDSRTDLYGDDLNLWYAKLVNGRIPLESDARFARAQTVLVKRSSGTAEAIGHNPHFTALYSDDLATVFVRKDGQE